MRSLFVTLFILLSIVEGNTAKRLGEGATIGDTYADAHEDDGDRANDVSRRADVIFITAPPTPTPGPHCMTLVDRPNKTYNCGDPITIRFNYTHHDPPLTARIDDRIGIYPCYISLKELKEAEVWQWACGGPPKTPKTCSGPRSNGMVVFDKLPKYDNGGQRWPLTANYNSQRKEVNRCFRAVLMRNNNNNDGSPYSHICHTDFFTVNENSKPGCAIRLTSPTD
ncbi:hypothetical protein MHU86_1622 [Fragilaria crotonensis]|nr:hypothetical protein MHU86_1622 [Fragilaria crotonensis]